mmetsp:Transcript_38597/g.102058  ORF Transcript_38597/g.102058 Transcript_38597/m.102058 type:complete len:164 (-) Transcript_38597:69-560(-)
MATIVEEEAAFYKQVQDVLGVSKDLYQASPALQGAHKYLEEHKIHQLLENLLARAALERPPDLRAFLAKTIAEMQRDEAKPTTGIFTTEDLETMFDLWDELKVGAIPVAKVSETLRALSCEPGREVQAVQEAVRDQQQVDKRTFAKIVGAELERTFAPPQRRA